MLRYFDLLLKHHSTFHYNYPFGENPVIHVAGSQEQHLFRLELSTTFLHSRNRQTYKGVSNQRTPKFSTGMWDWNNRLKLL